MKRIVEVKQYIVVEVDESKFTPEFLAEFRKYFYNFYDIDDHIEHLAQRCARGIYDTYSDFIEGYGPPKDFGIKLTDMCETEMEIQS
jgi:hypothetical protein